MSFTNTTPNYELPQYVADDKPTYLGDFNKSMLDIDTALKNNENIANSSKTLAENANVTATTALTTVNEANATASSANATANSAKTIAQNTQTVADNAQTTANEAKTLAQNASTTASQANSSAETASSTASSAKSIAENAQSDVDTLTENIADWIGGKLSSSSAFDGNYVFNNTLKTLHIYGTNTASLPKNNTLIGQLPDTFPAPTQTRTISNAGSCFKNNSGSIYNDSVTLLVDTSRNVYIKLSPASENYDGVYIQAGVCTAFWS